MLRLPRGESDFDDILGVCYRWVVRDFQLLIYSLAMSLIEHDDHPELGQKLGHQQVNVPLIDGRTPNTGTYANEAFSKVGCRTYDHHWRTYHTASH